MDLDTKIKETVSNMESELSTVIIDNIKTDGFSIRSGNKLLRLVVEEESPIPYEDEIRKELKTKVSQRLLDIGIEMKRRLNELSQYVSKVKDEYEEKKRVLDSKINSNNIMPDVSYKHACKGLSIVKSNNDSNRYMWLVQGVYWPKYINNNVIEPTYSKRLINHVIFLIETSGDSIMNVSVRKPIGLSTFDHYHRNCWGGWKIPRKWKTPDDIIEIARQAEVVLETINVGSVANNSPRGLMRLMTIEKHSIPRGVENREDEHKTNQRSERIGIVDNFSRDDTWSV
ncbi:hypothetical protein KKF82_06475 [Patescibacteria group bacterium]|nr:hypothetical protein [Patescibacteria group bacterium]